MVPAIERLGRLNNGGGRAVATARPSFVVERLLFWSLLNDSGENGAKVVTVAE
jgi:hypothetical protein